jgi:hypothetical protein
LIVAPEKRKTAPCTALIVAPEKQCQAKMWISGRESCFVACNSAA